MQKIQFIFASTLACLGMIFSISSCTLESNQETKESIVPKLDKKQKPTEHLMQMRSYPFETLDQRKVNESFEAASTFSTERADDPYWRLEGPTNIGGRINTLAINPQNNLIRYAGSVSGGVFKTTNGLNWSPITDEIAHLTVAHITLNPNNPDDILLGTGDPNISGFPHPGGGVYRSPDGGETWNYLGLEDASIISKVEFNPSNTDEIWAATMGIPFERTADRGLYKSSDGGQTWESSLYIDDETGVSDFKINPFHPDTMYAAGWTRIRNNQESLITGEKTRIYRSVNGGDSWDTLTVGLPEGAHSRIGLEISRNDPNTLWALYVGTDFGVQGIYKTTDAGETWINLYDGFSLQGALGGFGWYFAKIRVNPWDENEISVLGVDLWTSNDNGNSWNMTTPPWWEYTVHADKHDMIYIDEDHVVLATDGGVYESSTNFTFWNDVDDMPNTQFYRVGLNPFDLENFTGGAQDNGTTTGNADNIDIWSRDYGGDGFQPIFDPEDPTLRYVSTQNGGLAYIWDGFSDQFTFGIDPEERVNWDAPFIMSHHDPMVMYTGTMRVYENTTSPVGDWDPISDDLTDGNIFGGSFHTISTVAESPVNPDLIYAGTTDGNVWRGERIDGDWEWTDLFTGSILPERWVTNIKASKEEEGTVWVTLSGYRYNESDAHIYRSDDMGASWTAVAGDFPDQPVNHIETINDSILFAAADHGVYFTVDSGIQWQRVGNNMPLIPVFDIEIDTVNHRLVAGTFARGIHTYPIDSLFTWPVPEEEEEEKPISVEEWSMETINVFPNPCEGHFVLSNQMGAQLSVYDLQGRIVLSKNVTADTEFIDTSALQSGKYVIIIEKNQSKLSGNLIKL